MTTYRVCCCFRRKFQPATDEPPQAVREMFARYSENGVMGQEQLLRFLAEVQGEGGATREDVEKILDQWRREHRHVFHRKGGFSLDAFFRYLFGDDNPPLLSEVHQDMTAPLSHYFIYTGHNSYLTGNQLSSDCSDVPIIKALEKGVRVIELDLWPNPTKDNVDVTHGRTLTTAVELIKCLKSIKDHAFSASPYPVIITFEDHLTPDLQAKVAKMVTQTFGDMLYYPKSEFSAKFLSPKDLKRRIMISTKPPKKKLESKSYKDKEQEPQKMNYSAEEEAWGTEVPDFKTEMSAGSTNTHDHIEDDEDLEDGDHKSSLNLAPEYKKLIAITAKKRKSKLSESLKVEPDKVTRLSLNEQMFEKATISHGTEIVRFTQRNLLRLFPKSTRFDSSNYNPLLGWFHGVQMVAFNMQGYGRSLWLMQGMFRANGGCGYVKKPDFLLNEKLGHLFDPETKLPVKTTLKVKVYMGDGWRLDFRHTHFDNYSPPDFYTRVGIAGVTADVVMTRTRAIEDDWTPVWDEEFAFPLTVPELALLRVEVHEYDMSEKDDFGGQTCLPVWELRQGIRAVTLYDRRGDKYKNVKLLMHFEFV